ncbi:SusD/RagB family nutrient-binding outer membrane lipoprotein [Filimonas effusa]|uniref:SusD/RagB family nutrient-binding outer membrane lipoprotein n=1 Tax=Filimonas effusa TaxID=2508721 RepID=A0A4Q1D5S8_9BACT|nr:SusD/RagB family nutrient-binding outer membrane lipoprotein [Filimonas effusa]RXK82987.1 SusD/RagB family nutrient-binding outer membrane lipoprotein [Filimonas effusa]
MKQRKYIYVMAGLLAALSLGSCKKFLDVNEDPNNAKAIDAKLLFSFATTSYVNNRAGGDLYIPMALGGQSVAGGGNSTLGISWGTRSEDAYVFSAFSYGNIWTQFYTSVGANLRDIIDKANTYTPKNNNGVAQAKVLLAQTVYDLTTIYGDIPYKEAFNFNLYPSPHFDPQKDVLDSVVALVDQALVLFDEDNETKFTGSYDMFYGGDISKWIKAAKSIKLRALLTMVDKEPARAAAIGTLITDGGLISAAADNMKVSFATTAGKRNPKYAINLQYNGGREFFYGSPYVVDFMNANADPRLPRFFDRPTGQTAYVGIEPGANANDAVHAKLAKTIHVADQPEFVFTYQEALFYQAEVYARGLGVSVNMARADELYKAAITQSCIFWGVAAADAANFAAARPSLTSMTAADAIAAIHYQHWVDKMDRGIDAFTEWRRSGPEGSETPALRPPSVVGGTNLFRRFQYPGSSEILANPNAPEISLFNVKMWFDL